VRRLAAALAVVGVAACTSTVTSGPVVIKRFLGWTYSEAPLDWQGPMQQPRSWTESLGELLGSLTWLMVVGGLLGAYALYKFPGLVRRVRERGAARGRIG
jgi:hypothetical protein